MCLKNRIKTLGLAVVMTTGLFLSLPSASADNTNKSIAENSSGKEIIYTGSFTVQDSESVKSITVRDCLNSDLKYKSLSLSLDDESLENCGNVEYNKDSNTVQFVFSTNIWAFAGETIDYTLICEYIGGWGESDKEIPNVTELVVNDDTVSSNEVKLYISGVKPPVKSIDKSAINEKTETVTYTISSVVESKKAEYFYSNYVLSDRLEDVLKVKSVKVVNEDNKDVTNLFDISQNDNLVTATAKNTANESFYGHTYKLVIEACIKDKNTDISAYCDDKGKATIPNTSTLTVDDNDYQSNTVNFSYQTKSNSINKYIDVEGQKTTKAKLTGKSVTYIGNATVSDSKTLKQAAIKDKLNESLEYKSFDVALKGKDITNWGSTAYDNKNNTVSYAFNKDKLSDVSGETIEYTLNCEYKGEGPQDISNVIDLLADDEQIKSNDTLLTMSPSSKVTIEKSTTEPTVTTAADNQKTANDISNQNGQPNTGGDEDKAPVILFAGVLGVAFGVVVYKFRKAMKDNKEDKK